MHAWGLNCAASPDTCDGAPPILPSPCGTTSALWSRLFRSSMPCLHVPLSTLL